MWSAALNAAFPRNCNYRGLTLDDKLPDGLGGLVRAGLVEEAAYEGHHAYFAPPLCPNRRWVLGKIE